MTYKQSIAFLTSLIDYERWVYRNYDFKLDDFYSFLDKIGNPQDKLRRTILIAGTKGKGSTAIMISALLQAHGEKVGLYTSPHLLDYRERIKFNDKKIPATRFADLVEKLKPAILNHKPTITFFEAVTTVGFLFFLEQNTTINVFEVGLGGRLDATNVTNPDVSVITRIGHDHTKTLGNTLAKIASEKCGILRNDGIAVIANQHYRARDSICSEIKRKRANGLWLGKDYSVDITEENMNGLSFHYQGLKIEGNFMIPVVGAHQSSNAATALATAEVVEEEMDIHKVTKTLAQIKLPSRVEIIRKNPVIIIDMSHNQESALTLKKTLDRHFSNHRRRYLLIGITRHKNSGKILKTLSPFFTDIYTTSANIPRAIPGDNLYKICKRIHPQCQLSESVDKGLKEILPNLEREDILVVTGSVYIACEALKIFNS